MPPFGTALLVSGPEALLAQRIVADVKARALAARKRPLNVTLTLFPDQRPIRR